MTQTSNTPALSRRRALLAGGAAALTGAALAAPAIAQGAPRVIRMATSWPADLGGLADSAKRVAERVTAASQGRLSIETYWAGELVGALDVHDAAAAGDIEMYHSAEYYFQKKHRGMNFFTTVPMGLTSVEQAAWIEYGGGQELWDELNATFGVKALAVGSTGVQMGGWFNKEITSVADFEGLTMRMPGLGAQVITQLGAKAVVLPGGGIVEALFDGSIDATEWVGPYNDLQFGFQKLLSNYVYPGFHEPGTMASIGFNQAFWDSLTTVDQALIRAVARAELTNHTADYYGNNGLALTQLLKEAGSKPRLLPDDVWDALARASAEVNASVAQDDDMGRRIYDSYEAYRRLMGTTTLVSQAEYLSRRGMTDLFADV
ncbi:TRAP transporter substrate-binding protein [Jannaschia pohangensis]|uniref:TRAP-type mannitol/chloroaromatic compound transport system, substrate-binding protein n=1 Tax=Jannaschia pohangensis TaxID=390807 RepID=A0A1I3V6N6_9RHOB|nr:TRAP transporter substrate-binding protein [Jannaschia pohangensis]SFJ89847.1 TRAP-type mannitol/chloroaromatic compound transport system, substrate-binding protein [Jannaschia pohangensis]